MSQTITHGFDDGGVPPPRRLRVLVVSGPDEGASIELRHGVYVVGAGSDCDLRLSDDAVSRRHMQIAYSPLGVEVHDLDSKNGTFFRGARITTIQVGAGSMFTIGRTTLLLLEPRRASSANEILPGSEMEGIVGRSEPMQKLFATIRRVARSEATALITGESGTGKELVARAIHRLSPRRDRALRVVDLAATTGSLLEAELFGHEKGAFTGAIASRAGAFVEAHGGTVLLDEIGELDLSLQPRLLRAVERRQIKPIGGTRYRTVDVRLLAATNRDLQAEVSRGRFRADLFHRLAVVVIHVPPLRERIEDIPLLAEYFLDQLGAAKHAAIAYNTMQMLVDRPWPGNVRELRNAIERAYVLSSGGADLNETLARLHINEVIGHVAPHARSTGAGAGGLGGPGGQGPTTQRIGLSVEAGVPFKEAKHALVAEWERKYLAILIKKHGGNISLAARHSGIARVHLHRLLKKHGIELDEA